jgi:hypothetical protein
MKWSMKLGLLLWLALAGTASAEVPAGTPVQVSTPGQSKTTPHIECKPVAGNPELEEQLRNAEHPPPPPNGEPAKPTGPSACPPGSLEIQSGPGREVKKQAPFGGARSGLLATAAATGTYSYAGDEWSLFASEGVIYGVEMGLQLSNPALPANANAEAHSIDQLSLVGGGHNSAGQPRYTIEIGWAKIPGNAYAELFVFANNSYYEPGHYCYNACGFVVATGETAPWGHQFYPTDGSPGAKCASTTGEACYAQTPIQVKWTKSAWWVWIYGYGWVGYVPCSYWGCHFNHGTSESDYGEVYETGAALIPMGNAIAGNAVPPPRPAFQGAAKLDIKPPKLPSRWVQEKFNALEEKETPEKDYRLGNIEASRIAWNYGGPG